MDSDEYMRDDVADDWEAQMAEEEAREEEEAKEREAKKVKVQLRTVAEQLKAQEAEEAAAAAARASREGGMSRDVEAALQHQREIAAKNAQLSDLLGEDINEKEWPFPTAEQQFVETGDKMGLHVEKHLVKNLSTLYLEKLTNSILLTLKTDQLDAFEKAVKDAKVGSRTRQANAAPAATVAPKTTTAAVSAPTPAPVEATRNADLLDVVEDKGGAYVTQQQADEMDW